MCVPQPRNLLEISAWVVESVSRRLPHPVGATSRGLAAVLWVIWKSHACLRQETHDWLQNDVIARHRGFMDEGEREESERV